MSQHEHLDSSLFSLMMRAGHRELSVHKEEINALNVFPVPDGDTGTNMTLSFTAGLDQLMQLPVDATLEQMAAALSAGLLMGARGNSGVILSQLCRGFQSAFAHETVVNGKVLAKALTLGVQTAYKAVSRPVEGTILTVAREAALGAEQAAKAKEMSVSTVLQSACQHAQEALLRTPEQLPILRQAGVVDSGGQGLVYLLQGFYKAVSNEHDARTVFYASENGQEHDALSSGQSHTSWPEESGSHFADAFALVHGEGEYGYCTEMIIKVPVPAPQDLEDLVKNSMAECGDSLLVVAVKDPDGTAIVKVHVHTEHPGQALERGLLIGSLTRIKIDNMTEQNQALLGAASLRKQNLRVHDVLEQTPSPCGLAVVAAGDGLIDIFRGLCVDEIITSINGMNPSTEEIVQAVARIHATHIFVLPNHPNVIMAAEQAAGLSGGKLTVIPTRTIGSGLGAALAFSPAKEAAENEQEMKSAAARIRSGAVSIAVRDVQMGEQEVTKGDFVGVIDGELRLVQPTRQSALEAVLHSLCAQADICTIFCSRREDIAEAESITQHMQTQYPAIQFEVQYGGQPVYDYLLAAE